MEFRRISHSQAMMFMLLTGIMWSIAGLFIKLIPWHGLVIASLRSAVACAVVFIFIKASGFRILVSKNIIFGALALSGYMTTFVMANKLTTSANAIMLTYISPVVIAIIGWLFYKEKVRPSEITAMLFSLSGIILFFVDSLTPGGLLGNILALLSGFCMAVYFVISNKQLNLQGSLSIVFFGQLITAVFCLPSVFSYPPAFSMSAVGYLLLLGVVQLGLPYITHSIAIRECSALTCSLIAMVEPILNPLWVFLVIGEKPEPLSLVGGGIVITTVTAWCIYNNRSKVNLSLNE